MVVGSFVELDGSASFDPDGDPLTFHWTLLSAPPQAASVPDAENARIEVFLDQVGNYEFELTVTDLRGALGRSIVRITSQEHASILIDPGPDLRGEVLRPQLLSVDLDSRDATMVSISWSLVDRPAGSVAELIDPDGLESSLIPDKVGVYEIEVRASTPWASSAKSLRLFATPKQVILEEVTFDASYSRQLERLIYRSSTTSSPDNDRQIFIADLASGSSVEVPAFSPFEFALCRDGASYALSHRRVGASRNDLVSIGDMSSGLIAETFSDTGDDLIFFECDTLLTIGGASGVERIDLATGTRRSGDLGGNYQRVVHARSGPGIVHAFDPFGAFGGPPLSTVDTDEEPFAVLATAVPAVEEFCDELWPTEDGSRVLSGCGQLLDATNSPDTHMSVIATFNAGLFLPTHVDHSEASGRFSVVRSTGNSTNVVELYDDLTLASQGQVLLPKVLHPESPGEFSDVSPFMAFFDEAGTTLIVVGALTYEGEHLGVAVEVPL